METFSTPKELVENPDYAGQREHALQGLDLSAIDIPMKEIIRSFTGNSPTVSPCNAVMGIFYMSGRKIGTISSPCLFQAPSRPLSTE